MPEQSWMIYGAYGFTGQRIVDYALARGHRPVLAGRSKEKTQCLAERYGLDWISVDLEQHSELVSAIRQVRLVVHSAGPFIQTAPPMIQACLDAGVNYIDITGEIPVVQFTFAHNREAKRREILLLSGAGFDVITSDCLAKQLSLRAPDTRELEIIAATDGRLSSGTIYSATEILSYGGRVRRHGKLVAVPLGKGGQKFRFAGQERFAIPVPRCDLETVYQSTGIPNITSYLALPFTGVDRIPQLLPALFTALSIKPLRKLARILANLVLPRPDASNLSSGAAYICARSTNVYGNQTQAVLETTEPYRFTAGAVVRAVERIMETKPVGAMTPSQALGHDFILEVDETRMLEMGADLAPPGELS